MFAECLSGAVTNLHDLHSITPLLTAHHIPLVANRRLAGS